MREVVIVSGFRTAVGKANRGSLRNVSPVDYGAEVVRACVDSVPELNREEIEDLILGCSFPEGEQGMNLGRMVGLRAGLPVTVSGLTVNRYCSSGLQTIAMAAERIMAGFADVIIAGGVESMSMVPMGGNKLAPNPGLIDNNPAAYLSMGLTAENVATRYNISREEQDQFAFSSHQKAAAAIENGKFVDEIHPIQVVESKFEKGKAVKKTFTFAQDEGVRKDTSLAALAKLKPVFRANGSVTAGNSSQTSDGAAVTLVMAKEKADQLGLKPWAYFRSFAVGGVEPDVMGIGPVVAIPKALRLAGLKLEDIDLFELNEAFAAQALAVVKELGINQDIVNVNGGAIALGHPLGCTGAKLTISLLKEMERRKSRYGIVSMCIGGGMGAAGVFERFDA